MNEVRSTTAIPATPERVWDLLCDQGRYPEWGANTLAVDPSQGRVELGAERVETNKIVGPLRVRARWVVTAYDPPRHQEHRARELGLASEMTVAFDLSPRDDGTGLALTWRYEPTRLGRLLDSIVGGQLKKGQERSLAHLRELCQEHAPEPVTRAEPQP